MSLQERGHIQYPTSSQTHYIVLRTHYLCELVLCTCHTHSQNMTREEAQSQLWEGVEKDDGQLIEEAVHSGADLEEVRASDKMTPFTLSASVGRVGAVRALVGLGAQLERRGGEWQRTALSWACWEGQEAVVRELLAAGASLGADSRGRSTPLHYASRRGHMDIVRQLVEAGARINCRNSRDRTPLAMARGSVAVYLRSLGARK